MTPPAENGAGKRQTDQTRTALILSGGGARGAYQAGVLKAIAHLQPSGGNNPFDIICGTSAGAINASLLAGNCDHYGHAIIRMEELWSQLEAEKVHKVGFTQLLRSTWRLLRSFFNDGVNPGKPTALLDNSPLRTLLEANIDFEQVRTRLEAGDLLALSITALAYGSGINVSFFQGAADIDAWRRNQRLGYRTVLNHDHLMASSALPAIFPPVQIQGEYFGDGAVRQSAPLSTALHLGAKRLFVIGVSHNSEEPDDAQQTTDHPPSLAQISGHLLNSSFIDALDEDLETLERLNKITAYLSKQEQEAVNVHPVEVFSITPSIRFDELAARHLQHLPRSMRTFFRTIGATRAGGGASMASYLMFESAFCSELLAAGYADGMARSEDIKAFLNVPESTVTAP